MVIVLFVVVKILFKFVVVVVFMSIKKKVEEEVKLVKNGKDVMKFIVNIILMKEVVEKE